MVDSAVGYFAQISNPDPENAHPGIKSFIHFINFYSTISYDTGHSYYTFHSLFGASYSYCPVSQFVRKSQIFISTGIDSAFD